METEATLKAGSRVYLMGIGGIAMGNLAGALKEMGFHVSGSDSCLYPPMDEFLLNRNITIKIPYNSSNLIEENPHLVVVGNVIRASNPEARLLDEINIPYMSMADAVRRFLIGHRKSIVVSGTHGKSTTTAMLGWVLHQAGYEPSVFVGAIVNEWSCGYKIGEGGIAVTEGDEYDTAFFDKTPKFLHYNPYGVIITGIEFDHGDIYSDVHAIRREFEKMVSMIPEDGILVINHEEPYKNRLKEICKSRVITYGYDPGADWCIKNFTPEGKKSICLFSGPEGRVFNVRLSALGIHNALNCLSVVAMIDGLGLPVDEFLAFFETFPGLRKRQHILMEEEKAIIVEDFAHHPTEVFCTIDAIRKHFSGRKLVAIFEPGTNTSRRSFFQKDYPKAFVNADYVIIKSPSGYFSIPEAERLDIDRLCMDISKLGASSTWADSSDKILDMLIPWIEKDAVFIFMSNGYMDNLPKQLMDYIKEGRFKK